MHEPQPQPDVSTEPQRQALEEMSRQLVENLDAMIQEQHERAQRFAATQHSLSPLPDLPELEEPAPEWNTPDVPEPDVPPPPAPVKPGKKRFPFIPPLATQRKEPQEFPGKPLWEPMNHPAPAAPNESGQKKEEGCGTISTIIAIVIIVILLRACS